MSPRVLFFRSCRLSRAGLPTALVCTVATQLGAAESPPATASPALAEFRRTVEPLLQRHCYECHGDGMSKAGLAFDELTPGDITDNPSLWLKVLKNTRSKVMPPPDGPVPSAAEQEILERWIVTGAFALDPDQPDPGRVTVRRLNRTEYRHTLRDLIGVDVDVDTLLPPDDVGYGFDNIGDVLSISPMRMEKFIEAAMTAVQSGVPQDTLAMIRQDVVAKDFLGDNGVTGERMSFYEVNQVSHRFSARVAGEYRISINTKIDGSGRPDPQRVRVRAYSDGEEFFSEEYKWADADYFTDHRVVRWEPGEHEVSFVTQPLLDVEPLPARMDYRLLGVTVEGPLDPKSWVHPANYRLIYSRDVPPTDLAERRVYAREVLARFVTRAYRRPVSAATVDRLVDLAEQTYSLPDTSFEKGIAQAIVAVLASPRFLFHLETAEPLAPGQAYPRVDEHTLAARLSYALWASMPDEELSQLAARGELRKNFRVQVSRMLQDPKALAFGDNFAGQWLQSRGVIDIPINSTDVMAAEGASSGGPAVASVPAPAAVAVGASPAETPPRAPIAASGPNDGLAGNAVTATPGAGGLPPRPGRGFGFRGRGPIAPPGTVLTPEIRLAMKQEAEAFFNYIVRNDRSVLELLRSDYTFVNDKLAPVYGLSDVKGSEMRKVTLPADSLRGGVLTMGSVLTVTSNPTRTSPVKRGKWILENILGAPSPPPPPDVPALEDAARDHETERKPTQRELLALHREAPICASCHARMDPLGLALEGFNAFGRVRTQEHGQPIDSAGELATGEKFSDVRELKRALVDQRRIEFYRTLTEKLLTYTLGRGVEYYDVPTVDAIVARLETDQGRFSTLLLGVLESAPFQQRRPTAEPPVQTGRPLVLNSSLPSLP